LALSACEYWVIAIIVAALETTQRVPIALGEDGTFRIVGSRVTLDSVIHQFNSGATAEQIQDDFPSLQLRDIYGFIAYYLEHSQAMEQYLHDQEQSAAQTRQEIESKQDTTGLRERLRQRRAAAVK